MQKLKKAYDLLDEIFMLKIATAQYSMNKHSSLNAFKSNAEDWVKEAATHGARLVIFSRVWLD